MVVVGGFGGDGDASLSLSLAELDESQRNPCSTVMVAALVLVVAASLGVVVVLGGGFACASHSTGFLFILGEIDVVGGVVVGGEVVVVVADVLEVVVAVGVVITLVGVCASRLTFCDCSKNAEVVGGVLKFWS